MLNDAASMFHHFSAQLKFNVHPEDISSDLCAKKMISTSEKSEIDLQPCTQYKRMDKLLEAVQRAMNIDPQYYEIFLDILDKEKKYSVLVKKMRGNVAL